MPLTTAQLDIVRQLRTIGHNGLASEIKEMLEDNDRRVDFLDAALACKQAESANYATQLASAQDDIAKLCATLADVKRNLDTIQAAVAAVAGFVSGPSEG